MPPLPFRFPLPKLLGRPALVAFMLLPKTLAAAPPQAPTTPPDTQQVNHLLRHSERLLRQHDPVRADAEALRARHLAHRQHNDAAESRALLDLAAAAQAVADHPAALRYAEAARAQAAHRQLPALELRAHLLLGTLRYEARAFDAAIGHYRAALALATRAGSPHDRAEVLDQLGQAVGAHPAEARTAAEADAYLTQAAALFHQLGDRPAEAHAVADRAIELVYLGRRAEAETLARQAVALGRVANQPAGLADNLNDLAQVLLALDRPAEALPPLREATTLARTAQATADLLHGLGLLPRAYADLRRWPDAAAAERHFGAYRDTLTTQQSRQRLALLTNHLRAERQAARIGALQQQARINLLEAGRRRTQARLLAVAVAALLAVLGVGWWLDRQVRRHDRALSERNTLIAGQNQQLAAQATALQVATQAKDRLYALVAHDLRSPVAAFAGVTQLLDAYIEQQDLTGLQAVSGQVRQSATGLLHLLENLLHWAASQNGDLRAHPQPLAVADIFREATEPLLAAARHKHIDLHLPVLPPNLCVLADFDMARTLVRNLATNALKFTPRGGSITLEALPDPTDITRLLLRVRDTGAGLTAEQLAHLRAADADAPHTRGTAGEKGTGLGLPLCRVLAQRQGGTLDLASPGPGLGTTAWVVLPRTTLAAGRGIG